MFNISGQSGVCFVLRSVFFVVTSFDIISCLRYLGLAVAIAFYRPLHWAGRLWSLPPRPPCLDGTRVQYCSSTNKQQPFEKYNTTTKTRLHNAAERKIEKLDSGTGSFQNDGIVRQIDNRKNSFPTVQELHKCAWPERGTCKRTPGITNEPGRDMELLLWEQTLAKWERTLNTRKQRAWLYYCSGEIDYSVWLPTHSTFFTFILQYTTVTTWHLIGFIAPVKNSLFGMAFFRQQINGVELILCI